MIHQFKPPENIAKRDRTKKSVFVAGSIEMGKAVDWQGIAVGILISKGRIVFNPRRSDWDSTWEQTIETPYFSQQVGWELNAMEQADEIIMFFDKNTKSPISLLELGLFTRSGKLKVVCEDGFWRKGNVDIVCEKYNIPIFDTLDDLLKTF